MARFDVYRFPSRAAPLVVDVQSDLLDVLATCVVVPLSPLSNVAGEEVARLKPRLEIGSEKFLLMTTDIASVARSRLGQRVTNVEAEHRDTITQALDFLFSGY